MRALLVLSVLLSFVATSARAQEPQPEAADGPTKAPIAVDVVSSEVELEPVAVPEVLCADEVPESTCTLVTQVLRRDITLSGVFRLVNPKSYLVGATKSTAKIPFEDWFNVGARYLVEGTLTGKSKHKLTLSLYDVVSREKIPFKLAGPRGKGALMAVHRHVNAFMKAMTGRAGIFGSVILFTRRNKKGRKDIMRIRFGDPKPVTLVSTGESNMFPSYGPKGSLVYTSFKDRRPVIFVNKEPLFDDENQYRSARYSPNGKLVAVSLDKGDGQSDIWLFDAKGKPIKNLTDSPEDEVSPRWSRSGSHIIYVSNRTGNPQIHAMKKDGTNKRRISLAGRYNTSPATGPSGQVAFAGMDEFVSDIFTTDMSGNMQRITQDQGSNRDPSWSPDGQYIVFVSERDYRTRLYVGTNDGRWQIPVFSTPGNYGTPFWAH